MVINSFHLPYGKTATPASEVDAEGGRADDTTSAPMDTDAAVSTGNNSQGGTPIADEQKQSPDTDGQEPGQLEAEADAETGMIDGETDVETELEAAS